MDTYIGFDSAWTDNPKAPGAICAVVMEDGHPVRFHRPQLASFEQSYKFIQDICCEEGNTLIALDQPSLVPNASGMHPDAHSGAGRILDRHD